ncbi:MAG: helix-turn-helix domain-containing protein [Chloroflexi bacterium]|nr:helix-turn-helix domain-containing protein [Chloroflexota bacterium]
MTSLDDRALSVKQVAERLGISERTVFSLFAEGQLQSIAIFRRRLVLESQLSTYLHGLVEQGAQNQGANSTTRSVARETAAA